MLRTTLATLSCVALAASSVPAQTSALHPLIASEDYPPSFAGVAEIRDIEVERGPGTQLWVFLSARPPGQTDFEILAGRWDIASRRYVALNVTAAMNTSGDEASVTVTPDALHAVYDTPAGMMWSSRPDVTANFGRPVPVGRLPARSIDPCFIGDELLAFANNGNIFIVSVDVTGTELVAGTPTAMVAGADVVQSSSLMVPTSSLPGGGGGSSGGTYTNTYTYRKNGSVKKCIQHCVEKSATGVQSLSDQVDYYDYPPRSTGGAVVGGTHFFADPSTGGVHVAHFLDALAVVVPDDEAGTVGFPILEPVAGLGAPLRIQNAWLIGFPLRVPTPIAGIAGQLAVQPSAFLPLAPLGPQSFTWNFPSGLPSGIRLDLQPLRLAASVPILTFGAPGSVQVR
ncbi:MAG: hypothetical protein AAF628_14755 [Planctomycetota bacterium]